MFETIISPRFAETDALGHVGNTVMPVWFETAREPIFRLIHPAMSLPDWPLIIAHIDVDYLRQVHVGSDVIIKVGVKSIGVKSITVYHEAWQHNQMVAKGDAVMVYFDYKNHQTVEIPETARKNLESVRVDPNVV